MDIIAYSIKYVSSITSFHEIIKYVTPKKLIRDIGSTAMEALTKHLFYDVFSGRFFMSPE